MKNNDKALKVMKKVTHSAVQNEYIKVRMVKLLLGKERKVTLRLMEIDTDFNLNRKKYQEKLENNVKITNQ